MHRVITTKLKLHTTPEQFSALRQTQLALRDALNFVSRYAFAHDKMSNNIALQEGAYTESRARFGLPAQVACSVPRQVAATYKALWTKVNANAAAWTAGRTKRRYRGLDTAPRFLSPTLSYQRGYDCGSRIGVAKLWYDKPRKQYYLLVSLEIEVVDPILEAHQRTVKVDVGWRDVAVATDTESRTKFCPGQVARAKARHGAQLRKRLQRKGARAATRRLVVIAGRERRLRRERNHSISRQIVDAYPHSLIELEALTPIRERTRRRSGKKATEKQRCANRRASQWAFAELHSYVACKAPLAGSMAAKVEA